MRSDCLPECVRRGLQAHADVGEFLRRKVNPFLLDVGACLLALRFLLLVISALNNRPELPLHLLDGPSEVGELRRDGRDVLVGCHARRILSRRATGAMPRVPAVELSPTPNRDGNAARQTRISMRCRWRVEAPSLPLLAKPLTRTPTTSRAPGRKAGGKRSDGRLVRAAIARQLRASEHRFQTVSSGLERRTVSERLV